MSTAFATLVAASLKTERFTLVDVGCSGGIEPVWRLFGDRLRAVGFDASVSECQHLTSEEAHPDVRYVAAFVDAPANHQFVQRSQGKPHLTHNPFLRFSTAWAMENRAEKIRTASLQEKFQDNAWHLTTLADRDKPVSVPETLRQLGYGDVDFLKIDIDGSDFRVLNSFDGLLDGFGLLAARMEVNLSGGPGDTQHTFNNTDRFMRERGFELFALDTRSYSMRALPAPFFYDMPAQTVTGRLYQAEAFYARDLASPDWSTLAAAMSSEKLAKLAAIFSIWNQPDSAAEVLVTFRERLRPLFDVDRALDLLAIQAQPEERRPLSYRDYMALFAIDSPRFYSPPLMPHPTFVKRLATTWRAFFDPNNAFPKGRYRP